jgi:hypothetical protein
MEESGSGDNGVSELATERATESSSEPQPTA